MNDWVAGTARGAIVLSTQYSHSYSIGRFEFDILIADRYTAIEEEFNFRTKKQT